jgi:hypothetical protein
MKERERERERKISILEKKIIIINNKFSLNS